MLQLPTTEVSELLLANYVTQVQAGGTVAVMSLSLSHLHSMSAYCL
jgi:hypothetical protein